MLLPKRHLGINDRRRILAYQLGKFITCYNKVTISFLFLLLIALLVSVLKYLVLAGVIVKTAVCFKGSVV